LNGRRAWQRLPVGSGGRRRRWAGGVAGGEAGRLRQGGELAGRMLLPPRRTDRP
jgi:hypothetical protein